MKRWSQFFKQAGLDRTAWQALLLYLVVILLGLILIERIVDRHLNPELWTDLQWIYGIGVIILTAVIILWLNWRQMQSLRRSQARYHQLFEKAADALLIFDRAGRISDANTASSELTGRTVAELRQLNITDLLAARVTAPFDAQELAVERRGTIEWQIQRSDGTVRDNEVKIQQFGSDQFTALLHDITTRHRLEAALQESEAQLRALIGAMSDVIMVLDADGRFSRIEPTSSETLNQAHRQLLGLTVEQVMPPEFAAQSRAAMQRAQRDHTPVSLEYFQPFNNRPIWFLTTISALPAGQTLWVSRDVSEAKQHEQELAAIASLSTALRFVTSQTAVLADTVQQVRQWINVDAVALGVIDDFARQITLKAAYGAWEKWLGEALPLDRGLAAVIFQNRQTVAFDDVSTVPLVQRTDLLNEIHAFMAAPLQTEQTPLGILAVGRAQPFAPQEVRLLTALSDIAAAAVQRVIAQKHAEQRAERLAILNTSGHLLVESLSLPQVMEQLAVALLQLYPDMLALMVSRYDPAQKVMTCVYGWENGEVLDVSQLPALPLEPLGRGVQSECIHRQEVIIVDDLPARLQRAQANIILGQEPLSAIYAPLLIKKDIIGVVQVQSSAYHRFTDEDAQVLSLLASTAAVAIQNARLFEAERWQRTRAETLAQLAAHLNAQLDLEVVLKTIVTETARALQAPAASVYLYDETQDALVFAHGYGLPEDYGPRTTPMPRALALSYFNTADSWTVIPDIQQMTELPDAELYADAQLRTIVTVPIWRNGRIMGALNVKTLIEPRTFTTAELSLLAACGAQSAIAIENARLVEAERHQREVAEVLRGSVTAISSTLQREEVLDQILANTARLVPNDASSILVIEQDIARVVRWQGFLPSAANVFHLRFPLAQTANLRRMVETGQPLVISDTGADPEWIDVLESTWIKSFAGAPLRAGDRTLGMLTVNSKTPYRYTQADAERLVILADSAAIALDKAQLFDQAQQRVKELTALYDSSVAITATLDPATTLHVIAQRLVEVANATSSSVFELDWEKGTGTVLAEYWSEDATDGEKEMDLGVVHDLTDVPNLLAALRQAKPYITRFSEPDPDRHISPNNAEEMQKIGIKSGLRVPMIFSGQVRSYAAVWDSRTERQWTEAEIRLCQTLANQAAIALENARLFEAERKQLRLAQTLRDVGALLTASMSLDEVFDRLFDLLSHVINYDSVAIQLLQNDHIIFAAGRGFADISRVQEIVEVALGGTVEARWGQPHQRVLTIPDTHNDPNWKPVPSSETIRSWIGAALRVKGRLLGVLNVDSHTPNAYDAAAGETVAAFANQAAIALENAQLHEAVRRYAEDLESRVVERTAELERERNRITVILDAAGDGIMLTDLHGRIVYANPALEHLTGYTAAEILGRNSRLWQSGYTPMSLYEKMWRAITHGKIWQGELINRRKDGQEYNAALTIAPVFDTDGQVSGYVGVQRDISQQKELDRLKDEFVSNVSHELRTPIANVKLYINLLTRGKPEKYDDYLQTLRREAGRLEKLIEDLLDLSRLDLNTTTLILEPTDVNQLAAQLTADRTELAARKNLLIDYRAEGNIPYAQADAALLSQVISNLLTNAINYTPPGGVITVTTAARQRDDQLWVTITVQDTGPGIAAADLPHLFARFFRGEAGRKSGAPGTGLGLAISAQIMQKLGGHITVDGQPGEETAFTTWLKPA